MGARYYDREGRPITVEQWAAAIEDKHFARITKDERGDVMVSTVWLGLNHNWGDGPPLIFETMVFGGPLDEHCVRYPTEAAARVGHAEICSAAFRSAAQR